MMIAALLATLCLLSLIVTIAWLANYDEDPYSDQEAEEIKRWLDNGEK